ncbi:hypothetical protein QJR52_07065 [Clostridium baratii]|uniref:hypothetical protein n=1 Tax=Clostridium baratii TaxID=1561 RepID=UPI0030D205EB
MAGIRYIVQNKGAYTPYDSWFYICSFEDLKSAKEFMEKEKKVNLKIKYRILKQSTEVVEE